MRIVKETYSQLLVILKRFGKKTKRKLYYWKPIYKLCNWWFGYRQKFLKEQEVDYEDLSHDQDTDI